MRNHYKKLRPLSVVILIMMLLAIATACSQESSELAAEQTASPDTAQETPFIYKDNNGEHTLNHQPTNIATTVTYLTDHMIALGLIPTASVKSQNEDFPLYLKPFLNNVEIIGDQGKVNLEKLLSTNPDLIITDTNSEKVYDDYVRIAPTAMLENGYGAPDWQTAFRATATAFGLQDKAEQVITDYDKHKQEAVDQIHDKVAGKTLMILRIRNDIRYYGDMDYKWLYDDFGFTRPAVYPETSADQRYDSLSNEKLPEINPDYILLINDNETIYNDLQDLNIWKSLKAVKNNQVYALSSDSWFGGYGPNAANSMLDDLTKIFVK
jgi:iron complex transport system substrate-binding protein